MTEVVQRAGGVVRARGWQQASVAGTRRETATARTLLLDLDRWPGHAAGQHVDVRLTAEDGYQATRSYSLSSAPGEAPQITVERVVDGEVSSYLVDVARPGDRLEVRGPVGGYFVWHPGCLADPLLLVAGGSGIAPLRAIWRAASAAGAATEVVYSARTRDRVIFAEELTGPSRGPTSVSIHLTRGHPATASPRGGTTAPEYRTGRIDHARLAASIDPGRTRMYACGPTGFVEAVASTASAAGLSADRLRTERFG